ncbi:MAG: hypothetical protein N2045_13600 [Fimbriimonadales bacterium]|nr:hypothetical protein [Fimbriimonadales bacterium]
MRTIMILTLCAWSLWSWGGEPVNLSQQRLDAIFPVQPTDAEVRQHTVRITIEPPRYRTESTLTLYNPKNEPETLTLVVPLLEEVVFTEHAVRFDGRPLAWRFLPSWQVAEVILPQMRHAFQQLLNNDPQLHSRLKASLESYQQLLEKYPFPEEAMLLAIQPPSQSQSPFAPTPEAYHYRYGNFTQASFTVYKAIQQNEPVEAEALRWLLEEKGALQVLPAGRWGLFHQFNPRSGALTPAPSYARPPIALLQFEVTLQPQQTHTLSVRSSHALRDRGGIPDNLPKFYQLAHLVARRGWAKYGGLELVVSVPAAWQARGHPSLTASGLAGQQRVYRATLQNPPPVLYLAAAPRTEMESAPLYAFTAPRRPLEEQHWLFNVRLINGQPYVSCQKDALGVAIRDAYNATVQVKNNQQIWRWDRRLVGKPLTLIIYLNQPRFVVNGKAYPLTRTPLKYEGQHYLAARDALYIAAVVQNVFPDGRDDLRPIYRFILNKARPDARNLPLIHDKKQGAFVLDLTGAYPK